MGKITRNNVSQYPEKLDGIYNFPTYTDVKTPVIAHNLNSLKDAITAIQITIGADPVPDGYDDVNDFLTDISVQNFVEKIGDVVTGDIEFRPLLGGSSSRLFFGNNCNASITHDEDSFFNDTFNFSVDVGTPWLPDSSEEISNFDGVVPLSVIGASIFGLTSAGSVGSHTGHKIRVFNDVESKGALVVNETVVSPLVTFTPIEEVALSTISTDSFSLENVEVQGGVSAIDRMDFIGSEFSRSLEDDGPPTIVIPANSGYEILFVIFSAYLPYKEGREDVGCDGLKLKLNEDNINNPSLFAPFNPDKPNSLNNVSLMNCMVIPSTAALENSSDEFIVKFDPSIENRISLVRDGFTTFDDYPTLMHMVTVFGQKSGCFDVIRNADAPLSFDLNLNQSSGTYVDFDGTKYDVV